MKLLVDSGNSRFKWTLCDTQIDHIIAAAPKNRFDERFLDNQWQNLSRPDQILVSDVRGDGTIELIRNWSTRHWNLEPVFVSVCRTGFGVRCGYDDITQLGVDRWLAIISGWQRYQQFCCIVDCGTAVTIDVVDEQGQHQGGLILPGLHMMKRAIKNELGVDTVSCQQNVFLAKNTGDAVSSGCLLAITTCVDYISQELQSRYQDKIRYLLSGGGATNIRPHLQTKFEYVDSLIMDGLLIMALSL